MTHPDMHPGSLPEDRFDQWLDGLVAGTPADAASHNGTDGSLGRAMAGARQLHGLAAGTVPAGAAQRRIEEDLMRSGALAAPRGTTWLPIKNEARRTPLWSPASPIIAAALVVALLVALGASFIATHRPAPSGDAPESGAFAVASGAPVLLPAQEFATPAASQQEDEYVTSFTITAKDDIYVSISADGLPVFEGDLAAGQSTEQFTGSEFEVYTTSGENTLFTSSCGTPPFNMGHEPGEAYYILVADAASCPPEASPVASPPAGTSCTTTPPNSDVPPGQNADLDWLGSGSDDPSLWLMMTWNDGTIETNEVDDGYPVKLTFWRGEGSGEIAVTATGPDGETLPAGTFEPFQGDPIPGLHPFGGTLPEPGCWTFTATDGNDALTWTVNVQGPDASPTASPAASPVVASAADAVMVVEGTAAEARVDNGVRIATLGGDGLTLPVGGEIITVADAVQVRTIWGHSDTLHVIRADGTEAVVDLATGDILFEVPPFENWTREFDRWRFVPTDNTLTDWIIIDMTSGETRLLSELVDLPGDTAVMPSTPPGTLPGDIQVFQLELGTPEPTGWVTSDPAARTFVIAGSLDRVSLLPDYPTLRDTVGSPTLVASEDGGIVAYETRAGGSRIVVLDVTSGKVLARYSATEVGEDPTLAGFSGPSRDLIVTTDDGRVMRLAPDGGQTMTLHEGLEGIDNPLLFRDGSLLYVRQVDRLLRIEMLPDGAVREVATGVVPASFGFTAPGSDWIVARTRFGHIMVDARTGEIVSRLKAPADRAYLPSAGERRPGWTDADGSTFIFALAMAPGQTGADATKPAVWLLSPNFPDGLEVTAPEDAGDFWLSPDGETLYAYTSERMSGPGTVWSTSLVEETDWQVVIEDVTPLPNPMMFFSTE